MTRNKIMLVVMLVKNCVYAIKGMEIQEITAIVTNHQKLSILCKSFKFFSMEKLAKQVLFINKTVSIKIKEWIFKYFIPNNKKKISKNKLIITIINTIIDRYKIIIKG